MKQDMIINGIKFIDDGIKRFSIICSDIEYCHDYLDEAERRKDISGLLGNENSTCRSYRFSLGFRSIQEFCEVYSWFIRLGKYHITPEDTSWDYAKAEYNSQIYPYGFQVQHHKTEKRVWFEWNDVKKNKNIWLHSSDIDIQIGTNGRKYHNKNFNPRYLGCSSCGKLWVTVPIKLLEDNTFRDDIMKLKYELSYKLAWKIHTQDKNKASVEIV